MNTTFTAANLSGTWAFNVKGTDTAGKPKAAVGVFTVDSSGLITSGIVDSNDNGTIHANVAMNSGSPSSVFAVAGLGRGGIQFSTAVDPLTSYLATFLDANHLRLQSGEFHILTGDAYRVSSTSISGPLAFTLAGTGANGAFATGGILNTDGAGNIVNGSLRDTNDGGVVTLNSALAGAYSIIGNRATFSLNGGAINLVGYPSTGGIQLLDLDAATVASGVALPQSGVFSSSTLNGHYGATLSGTGNNHQFGLIAEISASSGQFSGMLNLNDGGSLARATSLSGSYTFSSNGRAMAVLTTASSTRNVILYAADSSHALFIETDAAQIGQGVLAQQK